MFGNLILAPIVAYYLLLDWANLVERSKGLIPPRWRAAVQGFLDETDAVLGQYLRGQLLVMGVLAVLRDAWILGRAAGAGSADGDMADETVVTADPGRAMDAAVRTDLGAGTDFDFRADLGDIWVEPADQPGPGLVTPTVDVTSAPKIIADIQAQTEKVLGAQDASAANEAPLRKASDVDASYAASGPDTVVVDAADTVFMDPGDTVVQDEHGASHAADARAAAASSTRLAAAATRW